MRTFVAALVVVVGTGLVAACSSAPLESVSESAAAVTRPPPPPPPPVPNSKCPDFSATYSSATEGMIRCEYTDRYMFSTVTPTSATCTDGFFFRNDAKIASRTVQCTYGWKKTAYTVSIFGQTKDTFFGCPDGFASRCPERSSEGVEVTNETTEGSCPPAPTEEDMVTIDGKRFDARLYADCFAPLPDITNRFQNPELGVFTLPGYCCTDVGGACSGGSGEDGSGGDDGKAAAAVASCVAVDNKCKRGFSPSFPKGPEDCTCTCAPVATVAADAVDAIIAPPNVASE